MSIWRGGLRIASFFRNLLRLSKPKFWMGTATTDVNGAWSVNYAAAGFTSAPLVQATVVGPSASANGSRNASLSAPPTTTTAAGIVTSPATISLLGLLTVNLVGAGAVVHITATGD